MAQRTFGAEIEKPVVDIQTGKAHLIGQTFFRLLAAQNPGSTLGFSDISPDTILSVDLPEVGHIGLDNAFNLQETASIVTGSLTELSSVLGQDLKLVQQALAAEGATTINLSNHPLVSTDRETYQAYVAPKGVYEYILRRGWDHSAGIDAKAQNSPAAGVEASSAARAVSVIIGSGAATIGLFANSPFAEGELTGLKESRLAIWDRMMRHSSSKGDRKTARFPDKPFNTLKDYFEWMFGDGTNIHFVLGEAADYKTFGDAALLVDGDPSVMDYLRQKEARAKFMKTGEVVTIRPQLSHLEVMQFAQFAGARIRWQFDYNLASLPEFLQAYDEDELERFFEDTAKFVYIEGRDAGAIFPDRELMNVDSQMAQSAIMAPSALQAGLIQNIDEAHRFISSFSWQDLGALREAAIKHGLQGRVGDLTVADFTTAIVEIAAKGLSTKDQQFLAYQQYVLSTGKNGADRVLAQYHDGQSIREIVKSRRVVLK